MKKSKNLQHRGFLITAICFLTLALICTAVHFFSDGHQYPDGRLWIEGVVTEFGPDKLRPPGSIC